MENFTTYDIPAVIYSLTEEYNELETTDERREEIEQEIESLEISFEDKIDSLATLKQAYDDKTDSLSKEIERLSTWKKRCEAKSFWLKDYIAHCLNLSKKDKLETEHYKFSFRSSSYVWISEGATIPIEFCRHKPEEYIPDKAMIKDALQKGQMIEGARIETSRNIQIK